MIIDKFELKGFSNETVFNFLMGNETFRKSYIEMQNANELDADKACDEVMKMRCYIQNKNGADKLTYHFKKANPLVVLNATINLIDKCGYDTIEWSDDFKTVTFEDTHRDMPKEWSDLILNMAKEGKVVIA